PANSGILVRHRVAVFFEPMNVRWQRVPLPPTSLRSHQTPDKHHPGTDSAPAHAQAFTSPLK
ncbi:MAG: hypothetical protein NZ729_01125, partial [Methylococcales bacterium]|nr:hypothetical protein [Methylococcales bacterium]